MKRILTTAAIVMSLMACGSGSNTETITDTTIAPIDTTNTLPVDTVTINTGDSTGINRDTARADRTRLIKRVDTTRR